jgi:hypothetical protein
VASKVRLSLMPEPVPVLNADMVELKGEAPASPIPAPLS